MKQAWQDLELEVLDVRETAYGAPNKVADYLDTDAEALHGPS